MKKQTMLNEPDELPLPPPNPEIKQPHDPKESGIPHEATKQLPTELPLENPVKPEIDPEKNSG